MSTMGRSNVLMASLLGMSFSAASADAQGWQGRRFHHDPPAPTHGCDPRPDPGRPVDLVICLDTSGSMTGLIDSARGRLWDVVNQLARMQPAPHLRVGLLTYGSPNVSSSYSGWVVRQIDLSDDLDTVYCGIL